MGSPSTFVFAGGGTGGHLFPGIAVAEELRRRDSSTRIVFVGSTRAIESTILAEHDLEHRMLVVEPLPILRRNPLRFAFRNWQAWRVATKILQELRPTVVIGLGGYASAPLVWAASRSHVPVVLIEQNVIPGRTTRWLSRFANHICVSFAETRSQLTRAQSIIVTGNPVREVIAALHDPKPTSSTSSFDSTSKPELLILGGSQGADSLNDALLVAIKKSRDVFSGWKLIHQAGPRQTDDIRQTYEGLGLTAVVESFFHDLPQRYASASLVISRAGATTLAELACVGVAMILLPYPHAADDHQRANAQVFVDHNAAIMVEHSSASEKTAEELSLVLRQLADDTEQRRAMGLAAKQLAHPNAAQRIAIVIKDVADQVSWHERTRS